MYHNISRMQHSVYQNQPATSEAGWLWYALLQGDLNLGSEKTFLFDNMFTFRISDMTKNVQLNGESVSWTTSI